jgi:hypothetical protein
LCVGPWAIPIFNGSGTGAGLSEELFS